MEASSTEHAESTATYVLQQPLAPGAVEDEGDAAWRDVATFTVPKRTQMRTVLLEGLKAAGLSPSLALHTGFRVLDADAALPRQLKVREPRTTEYEIA